MQNYLALLESLMNCCSVATDLQQHWSNNLRQKKASKQIVTPNQALAPFHHALPIAASQLSYPIHNVFTAQQIQHTGLDAQSLLSPIANLNSY